LERPSYHLNKAKNNYRVLPKKKPTLEEVLAGLNLMPIPRTNHIRYRVEVVNEKSEPFKDVGLTFNTQQDAEKWCGDFVPRNMSWRVIFETMSVVKYSEYRPEYLG
jgi:hypothetical protein